MDNNPQALLFEYTLQLGDDFLILGQRLGEWCGHGPVLEEDIALSNLALDCFGTATHCLQLAGTIEHRGRNENSLAFLRNETEFRNCLLVEQPNGDFAQTIMRQFFFSGFYLPYFGRLATSPNRDLGAIAEKAVKEIAYHYRHAREWVLRLGDGTGESHVRAQQAADNLWEYTGELFEEDLIESRLLKKGIVPRRMDFKEEWLNSVGETFREATLVLPSSDCYMQTGGRRGQHTEYLGHLLSEMQILPRSHPNAQW